MNGTEFDRVSSRRQLSQERRVNSSTTPATHARARRPTVSFAEVGAIRQTRQKAAATVRADMSVHNSLQSIPALEAGLFQPRLGGRAPGPSPRCQVRQPDAI